MTADDQDNRDKDRTRSVGDQPPPSGAQKLTRLGEFQIRSSIGVGGMGTVFLAYDESMKRDVALKVLHPSLDISKSSQIRFAREAWIAGQLEHRNIIRVYSRGEEERYSYIAMELADGGSLSSYIKSIRDTIQPDDTTSVTATSEHHHWLLQRFVGLAEALEHIHAKGFIHRDVKPHNILLSGENRQFKLSDFGIAHAEDMTRMTKAGDFIGTIKYMSPELLTAHRAKVDKRTDIYSLGVSLYEALTLRLPFEADTDEGFISEILSGHAIPARRRNKQIPRDLETVLLKSVHHDPDRRYQTATEFAEDLRRILESRPIRAKREGIAERGYKYLRRNRKALLAVLITVAAVLTTVFMIYDLRKHRREVEDVHSILRTAVETDSPLSAIDPRWMERSETLLKGMRSGSDSILLSLFLRSYQRLDASISRKYTDFANASIRISSQIDESLVEPVRHQLRTYPLGVLKTFFEVSIDEGPYHPVGGVFHRIINGVGGGLGDHLKLSDVVDTLVEGRHQVDLLVLDEFFMDAKLQRYVADSAGWKQVKIGNIITHSPQDLRVMKGTSVQTNPSFVDTSIKELEVWVFEEFPDGFPKVQQSDSMVMFYKNTKLVREVHLVMRQDASDTTLVNWIHIFGTNPPADALPVVGAYEIRDSADGLLYLAGPALIQKGTAYLGYENASSGVSLGHWGREFEVSISYKNPCCDSASFSELVRAESTQALLRIVPSIGLARRFDHIYEFLADTLELSIILRARYATPEDVYHSISSATDDST